MCGDGLVVLPSGDWFHWYTTHTYTSSMWVTRDHDHWPLNDHTAYTICHTAGLLSCLCPVSNHYDLLYSLFGCLLSIAPIGHWWPSSVCLYVCLSCTWPEVENGRAYWQAGSPWHGCPVTHLEVKRSDIKVTRPINTMHEKSVFGTRIPTNFKLGIGYKWSTTSRITDMRDDFKGQGHRAALGSCSSPHLEVKGKVCHTPTGV